jgi:tetratricopeptide (TPR) repeat protein
MAVTEEKLTISDTINNFVQKNRKAIIRCMIGISVLVIVLVAFFNIRNAVQSSVLTKLEELEHQYDTLRVDPLKESERATLLADVSAFAGKQSGYTAARAYHLAASLYADEKNWAEAQNAWVRASEKGSKTYLAPVALYNAAVAAEEQDDLAGAIDLYRKAIAYTNDFPGASRAQFAIGRIYEAQNDIESARNAYQELRAKWPTDSVWANLAQNRIIRMSLP